MEDFLDLPLTDDEKAAKQKEYAETISAAEKAYQTNVRCIFFRDEEGSPKMVVVKRPPRTTVANWLRKAQGADPFGAKEVLVNDCVLGGDRIDLPGEIITVANALEGLTRVTQAELGKPSPMAQ